MGVATPQPNAKTAPRSLKNIAFLTVQVTEPAYLQQPMALEGRMFHSNANLRRNQRAFSMHICGVLGRRTSTCKN